MFGFAKMFLSVSAIGMPVDHSKEAADVAAAYFEGVLSDLLKFGGALVTRIKPLQRSPEFATAVFDKLAVILASKYAAQELDYETADWLANEFEGDLVSLLISMWPKGDSDLYPELWLEVYEAFDAGEFDHFGRSSDPIAEFTDPQISEFLVKDR